MGRGKDVAKADRQRTNGTGRPRSKPPRKCGWNYPRAGLGPVRRWLPSWRFLLGTGLLGAILAIGVFIAAYVAIDIPEPDEFALAESTTVFASDGETEIGVLGDVNRQIIDTATLPEHVGNAVVASEDRRFYANVGIDPIGIARALWNNLRGGATQGGSTLTQQYVERYYLGTTTDVMGKFREAILAIKLDRELDKSEILDAYLNTIYFGRNTYGIESAAQAYFGKPAAELTLSEAAMLAGIVPAPSAWDPAVSPDRAEQRWNRVLDLMAEDGWITQAEREAQTFPDVLPVQPSDTFAGADGYLLDMVITELTGGESPRFSEEELMRGGLRVTTTIDAAMQEAAVEVMSNLPEGHSENLRATLVSIAPDTGGVSALYGGPDFLTESYNRATQGRYQAGSTFKPFTLAAALDQGIALEQTYPSYSPMDVDGWEVPNFDSVNRGTINLVDATVDSVNTVYAQLNRDVGPEATVAAAVAAGIPEDTAGLDPAALSNVLGTASPHAIDVASSFATFAAEGVRRAPHIVAAVADANGNVVHTAQTSGERAFDAQLAADVTYAMTQVVERGTGVTASALDRPVAGKTGSSNQYRSASFVGFVPQLSTVVALYQTGADGEEETITPFGGYNPVYGGSIPTNLWLAYMQQATEGMEVLDFPERSTPSPPPPPPSVTVPDVTGMSQSDAVAAIEGVGLRAATASETSETVPEGFVIGSSPGSGASIAVGSTVTILVSSGPPEPSPEPTEEPTLEPSPEPTEEPTLEPTLEPPPTSGPDPTVAPSPEPTDGLGAPTEPSPDG